MSEDDSPASSLLNSTNLTTSTPVETEKEEKMPPGPIRNIRLNSSLQLQSKKFPNNKISTTKYTPISFVPFFFWDQLTKPANFYFLIISLLQQIRGLSPTGRWGTILPYTLSLIVSAGKEIFEDICRSKEDESINKRKVLVVQDENIEDQLASVSLENIKVGQIVRILRNELIPADLVILKSSESHGLCYLETAAIDGETNLKLIQALTQTCKLNQWTDSQIIYDLPNNDIYNFKGSISLPGFSKPLPLDKNQFLPRGSFLVNTEWIVGAVVYTGVETKIMQNVKSTGRRKVTKMDKLNDYQNGQIVVLLFVLVAFLFAGHIYYESKVIPDHWYLRGLNGKTIQQSYFGVIVTSILLLNNLVPISMSVTLEIVRTFLAKLINHDLDMFDEELQIPSKAQSSNVLDELGRIDYIMTDKTGTLTRNEMRLKSLMVRGQIYKNCMKKPIEDSLMNSSDLQEFLEFLALCHTVMIDKRDGKFQASSPDELALLKGAKELGVVFSSRSTEQIELNVSGEMKRFTIKALIDFTSDRKRMSILVFDEIKEKFIVITKGADSVVLPLCNNNSTEAAETCVDEFSTEGLRTLCFAYKEISESDYENWVDLRTEALNANDSELLASSNKFIESNLNFIGISGIEDRLQDGVPEAISTLFKANIKIWILTGDRAETALNTAFLSGILKPHQKLIKLQDSLAVNEFCKGSRHIGEESFGLLISGDAFNLILNDAELRKLFAPLSEQAVSVIACRLSPLQKTEITHFVQNDLKKTTLAVGDGGNDVGMIQAADVGVGINGLEGTQAARSSDFSIAKFRFLVKLLLVHGTWSFHRISRVILYMMYKNFVIVLCQFWYSFFNSFSSQSAFDPSLLMLFNSFFSALPPALIGISDQYVMAPELIKHPQLYKFGQKGKFYNHKAFWESILNATVQSFIASASFYYLLEGDPIIYKNSPVNLKLSGNIFYFTILVIISMKIGVFTNYFTLLMAVSLLLSLLICLIIIVFKAYGVLLTSITFPLMVLLVSVVTLLRDFIWKFYKRQFKPKAYHIVQEMRAIQNRRAAREMNKKKLKVKKNKPIIELNEIYSENEKSSLTKSIE